MAKFPVSLAILLGLLPLVKGLPGNVCMFTDTGSKHQGKLQAIADAACNQVSPLIMYEQQHLYITADTRLPCS